MLSGSAKGLQVDRQCIRSGLVPGWYRDHGSSRPVLACSTQNAALDMFSCVKLRYTSISDCRPAIEDGSLQGHGNAEKTEDV